MKRYRLFVCRGSDCRRAGATALFEAAQALVRREGLTERCELARGGCYGLCGSAPNVVLREQDGKPRDPFSGDDFRLTGAPDEAHYGNMTLQALVGVIAEYVGRLKDTPSS